MGKEGEEGLNIQIDVDGVLADFVKGFYDTARYYIPDLPMVTTYDQQDWHNWVGIPENIQNIVWKEIKESKVWWYKLDPLPTLKERNTLSQLDYTDGLNMYFVTSRPGDYAKFLTERWIRTYIPIEHPTVIVAKHKAAISKVLYIDYSIEDNGQNAESIGLTMKHREHSYLIDRPYNTRLPWQVTRVKTIGEFLEKIPR